MGLKQIQIDHDVWLKAKKYGVDSQLTLKKLTEDALLNYIKYGKIKEE